MKKPHVPTVSAGLPASFVLYLAVSAAAAFFFFPVLMMAAASFKTRLDLYAGAARFFSFNPTAAVWKDLLAHPAWPLYLANSLIVSLATTIVSMFFGTLAAYALARFRLPLLEKLTFFILLTRMLPPIVMALPLFLLMKSAGLLDSRTGVIVAHTAFNLPFVIWMMREFIRALPAELEEAAMVDGLSRLQAFRRVLLPLLRPSLVAVSIFCLVFSYSEFLLAFILTQNSAKTLTVFIAELGWHQASAAGTAFLLPMLVFGLVVQKHLLRGLSFGAVSR
ncbi:MAG: carbohydrate ABC transporter permease [Thermodesulfobacteriota bacterium]